MIDNQKYIEIHKYLAHQSTDDQKEMLESWINASNDNRDLFNHIDCIWTASKNISIPNFDANAAWIENKEKFQSDKKNKPKLFKFSNFKWIAAAASFVILLATWMMWPPTSSDFGNYYAENKVIKVKLQDESTIFLDKNSSINTQHFSSSSRKVTLEGKGIFDVTNKSDKKFEVHSSDFSVIVVGTKFIVDTKSKLVKVIAGEVIVKTGDQESVLTANQSAQIKDNLITINDSDMVTEKDLFFNHVLKFNNTSLNQVFNDLETFFDVKFLITSSIVPDQCKFTSGSLQSNTLEEILQILKITFGLDYLYEKSNVIKIKNINCNHNK